MDPSFPRPPGPYADQVKESRSHAGPTSPDPDPGGTALGPAPKLAATHLAPLPQPTDGGGAGDDDDDDDRGVSPARPHPFQSSPPISGPSSPDGPGGGKGGEPEPPKPGGPRALPRRGLKSRLLRIKTNAGLVRPARPAPPRALKPVVPNDEVRLLGCDRPALRPGETGGGRGDRGGGEIPAVHARESFPSR